MAADILDRGASSLLNVEGRLELTTEMVVVVIVIHKQMCRLLIADELAAPPGSTGSTGSQD